MIVAVATEENMVAPHFGRCSEYTLFKLDGNSVSEKKVVPNPGHEPGFLPRYLAGMGVNCIIAGGMGRRAQALFTAENIKIFVGVSGQIDDVIDNFLSGNLRSGVSTCDHPQGSEHSCR